MLKGIGFLWKSGSRKMSGVITFILSFMGYPPPWVSKPGARLSNSGGAEPPLDDRHFPVLPINLFEGMDDLA